MSRQQVLMLLAAIAATITSVSALMLYIGNREKIAGATMDAFLEASEKGGSKMSPGRDSRAYTVFYRCAGKSEQSMWMLARDEAHAEKIIRKLLDCPTTRFVEDPHYWAENH